MEDALNLTDEEIYNDVRRPGSALSVLSEESPARPLRVSQRAARHSSIGDRGGTIRPAEAKPVHEESSALDQVIADFVLTQAEAKLALERAAEAKRRIAEEREALLRLAQQVITEDAREATAHLDRHCDAIYSLQGELRSQNTSAVRMVNLREKSEAVIAAVKQKADRTIALIKQEVARCPQVTIGTQIVSRQSSECAAKKVVRASSVDVQALQQTVEMLRQESAALREEIVKSQEETRCMRLAARTSAEDSRSSDFSASLQIDSVTEAVVDRSRGLLDSWNRLAGGWTDSSSVRISDSLRRLMEALQGAFLDLEEKLQAREDLAERNLTACRQTAAHELRAAQLKSEEQVAALREEIRSEERQSARSDIGQLRETNRKLSELMAAQTAQLSEIREKYDSLTSDLRDLHSENSRLLQSKGEQSAAMRSAFDAELARLKQAWKQETEGEIRRAKEETAADLETKFGGELSALQSSNSALLVEIAKLRQDVARLEAECERLRSAKETQDADFEADYAQKVDQLRKAYSESQDKLYKSACDQIADLERRLRLSEEQKVVGLETAKLEVLQSEEMLRQRLRQQLHSLHQREMDFLCHDIEDFVHRMRTEISSLARTVETALRSPSERPVLRGVWTDLSSLASKLEFRVSRSQREDVHTCADRECRRCGHTEAADCRFHPFLVKTGTADFLYSSEWHRCRDEKHRADDPPCCVAHSHYFSSNLSSAQGGSAITGHRQVAEKRSSVSSLSDKQVSTPLLERVNGSSQSQSFRTPLSKTGDRRAGAHRLDDPKLLASEQLAQYLSQA